MRALIDIRPLLEPRRSGVALYTACLLDALFSLPSRGDSYTLFSNASGRPHPVDFATASANVTRSFHRYPNRLLNASMRLWGRPRIETLAGGADVLYLPNLNFVATWLPLVVTVHDLSFLRHPASFTAKQRLWHAAIAPRRLLHRAAAVIAVSEHTKQDIMELVGIPEDRIHLVLPAAAIDATARGPADAARTLAALGVRRPFFLFLATQEPRKNVPALIRAFERLPDAPQLVLAGGAGWKNRDIARAIAASPAADRILRLGYVDETQKAALYAAARAFVYPSVYEGFGMPPLEAMASGTPVITSHATSLGEVVGDAALTIDPYDERSLTDAMRALLTNDALRDDLRERGLARAALFSWRASAERLHRVLTETAASTSRTGA